ncbi:UNVERIFIED_CONTAM: hypothetical protein FKN15_025834 [Acipenser sinensis]
MVISESKGQCYRILKTGFCTLPILKNITKQICCCSRVGKAWGRTCERCPPFGSEEFKEICPAGPGYHYSASSVKINQERQTLVVPPRAQTQVQVCDLNPQICGAGRCLKQRGGAYTCLCNRGYHINPQKTRCVVCNRALCCVSDVDECSLSPRPCTNGQCENTAGSYRCLCPSGFRLGPQGASCTDTDECRQSPSPCTNARCENTPGSYRCVCAAGYQPDHQGAECTGSSEYQVLGQQSFEHNTCCRLSYPVLSFPPSDINECENPLTCPGQECVNSAGSFRCVPCQPGYQLQNSRCTDVDECSLSPWPCTNGQCENTAGSYRCLCPSGFRLGPQGASCTDTDECWQSPSPCTNARCENTPGSYRCVCAAGYQPDHQGAECTDINECENPLTCPGQECVNSAGSFQCVPCQPGYQLQNSRCTVCNRALCCVSDVDECSLSPRPCTNGQCENTAGSYRCLCPSGFRLGPQGASCTDINECRLTPRPCSIGQCENTAGSYRCVCPTGYRLNSQGTQCIDTDECRQSPSPCTNARCENTPGSYRCVCAAGYQPDHQGADCTDTDECRQSPSPCTNARCENTPGSYRCVCAAGYQLDHQGAECTDINECENALTCPGQECVNSAGSFRCVPCQPGYQLQNSRCTDVDECQGLLVCGTNGQCLNTEGSFLCDCKIGFRSDSSGRQCRDINECLEGDFCFPHGECLNTEGSYSCLCSEGYKATPDGGSCIDVDECARPELCQDGICTNTQGSFECVCQPGFTTNPEKTACLDIDECADSRGAVCGPRHCENTIGSFHCITSCEPGHRATASGDCVDINECANDTVCGDHAFCQNLIGSYQCLCDQGYEAGQNGRSCVDVNECDSMQGACGAASCENVEGSFLCICGRDSEEFDPRTGQCISRDGEAQRLPTGEAARPGPYPPHSDVRECYYNIRDANVCQNILTRNTTLQECCCTVGEGWGENCQLTACPAPGTAEYQAVCPSGKGYVTSTLGSFSYKDVDECTLFSSEVCKNGVCVNMIPEYSCYCPNGYYYDQTQLECVDNDECLEEESCLGGSCVNTVGSYYCSCESPLILDAAQRECVANISQSADEYEALCDVLRAPAYGPPTGPYAEEYEPRFGGDYEPPYSTDTFAEPPPRGRTPDYLRPGGYEDYPSRGGRLPSYGSSSRSPASYRPPEEGPYGRRGPGRSYDLGDFEAELPYASEPRPPFGRADSQVDPYYESRQGRYRPLSSQSAGPPSEPDEPSAAWLQYRPRGTAPNQEYPDRPQGDIRRETYESRYELYEGLSAEECGILHGCENGRCIRVPEGYTCDCYDGYHLDISTMTCRDVNECDEAEDPSTLCVNGQCLNTDGSFQCVCLRGFVMSRQRNYCIPARPQ